MNVLIAFLSDATGRGRLTTSAFLTSRFRPPFDRPTDVRSRDKPLGRMRVPIVGRPISKTNVSACAGVPAAQAAP